MTRYLLIFCMLLLPTWSEAAYQSLGKAEDSAAADADNLIPTACQSQTSITSTINSNNDYSTIKCDANGRQYVSSTLEAGSAAIGSVSITSQVPGVGATNLGKREDDPHTTLDTGVFVLGVRHDNSTTGQPADGEYSALNIDSSGQLYTKADTEMPVAVTLGDNTSNPTVPGVAAFLMCFDGSNWDRCQPSVTDTDDGSVASGQATSMLIGLNHVYSGSAWVRNQADPCSYLAKTHLPINISTATTTEITPSLAGASTNYYVCSLMLVTNASNIVTLVDDNTDGCGSPTAGMAGGLTTAGWTLAANGGLTFGNGQGTVFKTVTQNAVICLITSAATQLSGAMSVVAAP